MPNFNGAIVMHTLEVLKNPATMREILCTLADRTELPLDDLKVPVKQTLEMGHRFGFLQKSNGRYFLLPMTFNTLMSEKEPYDALPKQLNNVDKPRVGRKEEQRVAKVEPKMRAEKKPKKKTTSDKLSTKELPPPRKKIESASEMETSTTTLIPPILKRSTLIK